jgi:flagellar basal-body rod protein FlgB
MFFGKSKNLTMKAFNIMHKGLTAAIVRHKVIANNIANVNTPGFKRSFVCFESELKRALEKDKTMKALRTHPKHMRFKYEAVERFEEVTPKVVTEYDTIFRNDENNVDLDIEMANLAKNTILYDAMITRMKRNIFYLRQLINIGAQ